VDQAAIKVLATSDIDGCKSQTFLTISISSRIVPVFDPVTPVCETETITLPTTSINGITGEWVLLNSTTTSKEYGFTPDSTFCATEVNMVVEITVLETPSFNQLDPVCETDTINLPTTSLNSITGEWALISEDPDSKNYEFTPDVSQCANTTQMTIQKIALETPNFSQVDPICETQSVNLPTTSTNGITGTWALIFEDASSASYEFTPDANQCADVTTMVVQINELIIPYFEQIEPICSGSEVQLPNISEGGSNISGEWSLIDESANYVIYEFTPNANQCASEVEMTIEIIGCEVPEGFSPNGDAYNQYFDLSSFGVKRLEVYNRYGKLVYSRNNYKKEWFGQDSGNGALPTGTYFYIITFNDNSKPKSGSVYINR
jgi:gliding motility-associated-like protein